jgi:hypothetical protein
MEQLPLNGFVRSLFDGYKAGKEKRYYPRRFEEMKKTNLLFGVDDLNDMLDHAEEKEDYETILDHMYRFNATDGQFGYYKRIEKKIINEMWEE